MKRIDILVNNVGTGRGDAPPHAIEEEAWDRIMDINLKSMMLTIRHVLPVMRQQKSGAILNISSLAAIAGHHMVTYEVSKVAVNRLTTVVAAGQRQVRRALQRHHAGPDGYAHGDHGHRRRQRKVARGAARRAQRPGAHGRTWAPAGIRPTRRCSSARTRPNSSPAWRCRWTAACRPDRLTPRESPESCGICGYCGLTNAG